MRRSFGIEVAIVGLLGAAYFGFARFCLSPSVLIDSFDQWPRPFPWPDLWLESLAGWFDSGFPRRRAASKCMVNWSGYG